MMKSVVKCLHRAWDCRLMMVIWLFAAGALLLISACTNNEDVPPATIAVASDSDPSTRDARSGKAEAEVTPAASENDGSETEPTDATGTVEDPLTSDTASREQEDAVQVPNGDLVVCLEGTLPNYALYGDTTTAAAGVRHALYENLFTTAGYAYQAQGLEKLPSLADGDAQRTTVLVSEEDTVVDASGRVVNLRDGISLVNANGEIVAFDGEPIEVEQMIVDFTFRPMVWSDGEPVTARDSVFSFEVAADPFTRSSKGNVLFTQHYEATGELSVRWTGLPGFLDQTYFTNVWQPLPAHALEGVPVSEITAMGGDFPSNGPYRLEGPAIENELRLAANPFYYRLSESLPRIGRLALRFGDAGSLLTDETCDVVAGDGLASAFLTMAETSADWQMITSPGHVYEQMAFGVQPVSDYAERRPDWFGDSRVRQGIARCVDRQQMVDELTSGAGELLNSFVPSDHPLAPADLKTWSYDPEAANQLLDEAGYLDFAGDGRRQDVASGVPMTITLGVDSGSSLRLRIAEFVEEDLADCGIPVTRIELPAGTWFFPGPQGPLFGRQFDLALSAWVGYVLPLCERFTTAQIPGPSEFGFGGWEAPNVSGWSDEAFDAACEKATAALPGGEGYSANMSEAVRILSEQLPVLPLFTNYRAAAVRPNVQGVTPDALQDSVLWNVFEWDLIE